MNKILIALILVLIAPFLNAMDKEARAVIEAAKKFDTYNFRSPFTDLTPELIYQLVETRAIAGNVMCPRQKATDYEERVIVDSKTTLHVFRGIARPIEYTEIHNTVIAFYKQCIEPLTFILSTKDEQGNPCIIDLHHVLYFPEKPIFARWDDSYNGSHLSIIITKKNEEKNWRHCLHPQLSAAILKKFSQEPDETQVSELGWDGLESGHPLSYMRMYGSK